VALKAATETFTNKVGALSTTQLEAPNATTKLHNTKNELRGRPLPSRVPTNPRVTSFPMESGWKSNPFGGSVDLGLLPQIPKGHQELLARERDLEQRKLVFMEERG
jgi:hypothetical protein